MKKNPYYKETKGTFPLLVSCAYCKEEIFTYQKKGVGNLLNTNIERIIKSKVDLTNYDNLGLFCPNCEEQLGSRAILKGKNVEVFRMIRGATNIKRLDR